MAKITNKTMYLPEAKKITTANEEVYQKKERRARNNNRKKQEGFRSNLIEVIPKNQSENPTPVIMS